MHDLVDIVADTTHRSRLVPRKYIAVLILGLIFTPTEHTAAQSARRASARDTIPMLFAEGIVSTGDNEFSTAVSPDGRTVYWTVSAPNVFVFPFVILTSTRTPNGWSTPRVAPFSGIGFSDADPAMSPDGRRIFFMSRRPAVGALAGGQQRADFNIWVFDLTTKGIASLDAVNSEKMDLFPSVTSDGTLYFTSDRDGGYGSSDIYRSHLVNGRYTSPENLGPVVNSTHSESNVFIARDESYVIFSGSGRPGNKGGADLYIAHRESSGAWNPPRPLKYVNSEWDDYAPTVSPDGQLLYFTSRRPRVPEKWRTQLVYEQIREHFRSAGNGNADIYTIPFALAAGRVAP
jgi:Tol biopolymer transport system component